MTRKRLLLVALVLSLLLVNGLSVMAQDEFVFGLVLVGPKNDRGWSQAHFEAGERLAEELGGRMVLFESLNPADNPQTTLTDVAAEMIDQGAKLIITTSDSFEEDTSVVAAQFPDTIFVNTTGSTVLEGSAPPNVGNVNSQFEWVAEIAGCASALATETGSIGYVGPLINFETRRHAAATYLGAKHCWETYREGDAADLTFSITWIGFWFGIPGVTLDPTAETQAFFDNGADVVISGIDTTENIVVASQLAQAGQKVFAVGHDNIASCDEAPDICLGAPYYNWFPIYLDIANSVIDGTWTPSWTWIPLNWDDLNNMDTSPAGYSIGDGLTDEQQADLEAFIAELTAYAKDPANADSFFLFEGPLNFQDGTVLAAEGEKVVPVAPLGETPSIWYLPLLLEGMTGASTSE
ncbi:MAG: BMP family ABC transporter substrate-binding protein [Anaerolineae bacterium]|nr:BMP family ABC transporter substrate-binding protein [Anaerolineae bacterium]